MRAFRIESQESTEAEWSFGVLVPSDCAFFDGHFPGAPMLPAVAHFALVEELLERIFGTGAHITGVRNLRLRGAVLPDRRLAVRVRAGADSDSIRWSVRQGEAAICEGALNVGRDGPPCTRAASAPGRPDLGADRDSSSYLPHRAPALFVQEVLETSADGSSCSACVPADSPFVMEVDGSPCFPTYLCVELGAQAAAATEAHQRARLEPGFEPTAGYIVRASQVELARLHLPAQRPLCVRAALLRAAPPLRTWKCAVELGGQPMATAEVSTWATNRR